MALRHAERWPSNLLNTLMPIMDLMEDESITEVMCNAYNMVWAKCSKWRGHKLMQGYGWKDRSSYASSCQKLSEVVKRRLSEDRPLLNGRLPGGERVNVVFNPACDDIALTIRKFPAETMTISKLLEFGSINQEMATLLRSLVLSKRSTIVSGGTGSGKTSLLNALSAEIPANERIITVEDSRELQIQQPNWVALETVEAYKEGALSISIGDLVRNTLRMTPDRIIVGEVRGEEAFYLLRAFSTGHGGGFGTVHANDAEDGLRQLQFLSQMAPIGGLSPATIGQLVGSAVDIVVHAHFFDDLDGSRKVTEILEIEKPGAIVLPNGMVRYQVRQLAKYVIDEIGTDEKGEPKIFGRWEYHNRPSQKLTRLAAFKGLPLPEALLQAPDLEEIA